MQNMIKLYNCDCRESFKKRIRGVQKEIIIVTDPPFNIGYHYNSYKDKVPDDEYYNMLVSLFKDYPNVIIHYPENLYKLAIFLNKAPTKVVSWVYNSNTGKQHRDIAFFDIKPNFRQVKNKVCQYLNIINYLLRRYKGNKAKIPTDIINEKTQRELVKTTLEDSTIEVKIIEKKEDVNL